MKSYEGYDKNLVKETVFSKKYTYTNALDQNMKIEPTPYLHRTAVSKGLIQTIQGGFVQLYDTTGGTLIFTYDPDTAAITLNGALVNISILSVGTIKSTTFVGTITNSQVIVGGTYNNGTLGTPTITGGSYITGTLAGTPVITGAAQTGGSHNSAVFGTPTIIGGNYNTGTFAGTPVITGAAQTGGSHNNAVFGTPTLISGSITDKLFVGTGANSSVGLGTLATGVATISTTKVTANSLIFITPRTSNVNIGILSAGNISVGTSFVVTSSNTLDNDTFNWWLIN